MKMCVSRTAILLFVANSTIEQQEAQVEEAQWI
jgi:hypothetical protein